MNPISWPDVEMELAARQADVKVAEADRFWDEFRCRAGETHQDAADALPILVFPAWAKAAACLVAIIALTLMVAIRSDPMVSENEIQSLDITASHSSVFVVNDYETMATIVWVSDLEINDANGDGT